MKQILCVLTILLAQTATAAGMLHFKGKLHSFDEKEIAVHQGSRIYYIKRTAFPEWKGKKWKTGEPFASDVNMNDVLRVVDKK